jgi:hypothetical protein
VWRFSPAGSRNQFFYENGFYYELFFGENSFYQNEKLPQNFQG